MGKPKNVQILDDGFGNQWEKCGPTCKLEIVRPGKVQCDAVHCPFQSSHYGEKPALVPEGAKRET